VRYSKAFFGLQLHFPGKVAGLSGRTLAQVPLHYTNFYIRLGLGRDFNGTHPVWQTDLKGLRGAADPLEWTYIFYTKRARTTGGTPVVDCFQAAISRRLV
jgi:hypothetical protein